MAYESLFHSFWAVSRISAFDLLRVSQNYVTAVKSANVLLLCQLALESMDIVGWSSEFGFYSKAHMHNNLPQ